MQASCLRRGPCATKQDSTRAQLSFFRPSRSLCIPRPLSSVSMDVYLQTILPILSPPPVPICPAAGQPCTLRIIFPRPSEISTAGKALRELCTCESLSRCTRPLGLAHAGCMCVCVAPARRAPKAWDEFILTYRLVHTWPAVSNKQLLLAPARGQRRRRPAWRQASRNNSTGARSRVCMAFRPSSACTVQA